MRNCKSWAEFVAFVATPRFLVGASVLRVVAGATILYQILINYAQRHFLFGPNAVYPYEDFLVRRNGFSIYALSSSTTFFEVAYHLGVVVAFVWTLGIRTRITTPLIYVFWYSLRQRNQLLWDGGDNLMQLVLVYAIFADTGAHLSLDSASRRTPDSALEGPSLGARVRGVLHNGAMLAIALQLSIVYAVAGLSKVQGETWRNGTALYYALRAAEFYLPNVSERIYASDTVLALLCHMTVLFQVAFPFLVFLNPWTRRAAVLVGITFHMAIGSVMGLVTFASFMMAVDLSLVADAEYRALGRLALGFRRWSAERGLTLLTQLRTRLVLLAPAAGARK